MSFFNFRRNKGDQDPKAEGTDTPEDSKQVRPAQPLYTVALDVDPYSSQEQT